MGNRFMPGGVTDRLITLKANSGDAIGDGLTVTMQVLNQTGKTIQLLAFNGQSSGSDADATANILNATGTMLSALADISVASTAGAGTLHATNITVASGGTVRFQFANLGAGGVTCTDAQATALFTVIA